ncbi:MAG TPA: hypothetical protein VK463_07035 [Desulfomonilaceae bacterium]|nr:hypothetical protein [Desulfomonilaceae bacterium]
MPKMIGHSGQTPEMGLSIDNRGRERHLQLWKGSPAFPRAAGL